MTERRLFRYHLRGPGGFAHELSVIIDGSTQSCVTPAPVARPWTVLERHQCPNCPLDAADTPLCPFAARIEPVVAPLGSLLSYERIELTVDCGERLVSGTVTAQAAASSLIGLIGAVSGCPHTAFLKPMAWFHQPLATEEETIFRATAAYLVSQYFAHADGREPDWDLRGLKQHYEALHFVNRALASRLREAGEKDATVNAIVRLDMFAKAVPWSIDEALEPLRPLFRGSSGA